MSDLTTAVTMRVSEELPMVPEDATVREVTDELSNGTGTNTPSTSVPAVEKSTVLPDVMNFASVATEDSTVEFPTTDIQMKETTLEELATMKSIISQTQEILTATPAMADTISPVVFNETSTDASQQLATTAVVLSVPIDELNRGGVVDNRTTMAPTVVSTEDLSTRTLADETLQTQPLVMVTTPVIVSKVIEKFTFMPDQLDELDTMSTDIQSQKSKTMPATAPVFTDNPTSSQTSAISDIIQTSTTQVILMPEMTTYKMAAETQPELINDPVPQPLLQSLPDSVNKIILTTVSNMDTIGGDSTIVSGQVRGQIPDQLTTEPLNDFTTAADLAITEKTTTSEHVSDQSITESLSSFTIMEETTTSTTPTRVPKVIKNPNKDIKKVANASSENLSENSLENSSDDSYKGDNIDQYDDITYDDYDIDSSVENPVIPEPESEYQDANDFVSTLHDLLDNTQLDTSSPEAHPDFDSILDQSMEDEYDLSPELDLVPVSTAQDEDEIEVSMSLNNKNPTYHFRL